MGSSGLQSVFHTRLHRGDFRTLAILLGRKVLVQHLQYTVAIRRLQARRPVPARQGRVCHRHREKLTCTASLIICSAGEFIESLTSDLPKLPAGDSALCRIIRQTQHSQAFGCGCAALIPAHAFVVNRQPGAQIFWCQAFTCDGAVGQTVISSR